MSGVIIAFGGGILILSISGGTILSMSGVIIAFGGGILIPGPGDIILPPGGSTGGLGTLPSGNFATISCKCSSPSILTRSARAGSSLLQIVSNASWVISMDLFAFL